MGVAMNDDENAALQDIGRRIRAARETGRLNLHDLARLSGVSAPALSLIETGKRDLRITTLNRIANALRVRAGDLLDEPQTASPDAVYPSGVGYDLADYA